MTVFAQFKNQLYLSSNFYEDQLIKWAVKNFNEVFIIFSHLVQVYGGLKGILWLPWVSLVMWFAQKTIAPISQPIRIELKAITRVHALDAGHTYMFPDLNGSFDCLYGLIVQSNCFRFGITECVVKINIRPAWAQISGLIAIEGEKNTFLNLRINVVIKCVIPFILLNFILNCVIFMHVSFCGSVLKS